MMNVQEAYCDNHFRMYKTIVLYTLNLCSAVCQLHCNKTVPNSKNKVFKPNNYFQLFSLSRVDSIIAYADY